MEWLAIIRGSIRAGTGSMVMGQWVKCMGHVFGWLAWVMDPSMLTHDLSSSSSAAAFLTWR